MTIENSARNVHKAIEALGNDELAYAWNDFARELESELSKLKREVSRLNSKL